jgi:hypothetical protein
MNEQKALRELVGRTVRIFSVGGQQGFADTGRFLGFDGWFVRIEAGGDELYFPVNQIRLIKPVD